MRAFADKLNMSSWRGCISEVGVGIPFSSEYVSIPGASNTILWIESDYAGMENNPCVRAVSLENAKNIAQKNLHRATKHVSQTEYADQEHLFGLSITGAHYKDKSSHAWVYLATPKWTAHMHFYTLYPEPDRKTFGRYVNEIMVWFLQGCFFGTQWSSHITTHKPNIDVLYAPGVSDFERMLLLRDRNPLAINAKGEFVRVEDIVRETSTLYSGSFNPPTKRHLQNALDCLCEISQNHVYKGDMSLEDMLHRVRMLVAAGRSVLITRAPRFIDKYLLLDRYLQFSEKRHITFKVGVDAWNATIAAHQYPSHEWLGEHMPHARFLILSRVGYRQEDSPVTTHLQYHVSADPASAESSTSVRSSDVPHLHEFLTPDVSAYILQHNLYAQQN